MTTTPTNVVRCAIFKDAYKIGETNTVWGTYDTYAKANPVAIIWVHGSGEIAMTVTTTPEYRSFMRSLGKMGTVVSGDYGFQTWGNDIAIDAIDKMIDYVVATYGAEVPIILTGGSMGGCNCLNYIRVHPTRVKAAVLVIPLVEINYVRSISPRDVDSAYPPSGWSESTYGATHNPITFVTTLDPTIPIYMYCASDDTLCPFIYAQAFAASAPNAVLTDLGKGGHSTATVNKAFPLMIEKIKELVAA